MNTVRIELRVTPEEGQRLRMTASVNHRTLADWIRHVALQATEPDIVLARQTPKGLVTLPSVAHPTVEEVLGTP